MTQTDAANGKSYKPLYVFQGTDSAKAAGLRYLTDTCEGIARIEARGGFRYVDQRGRAIRERATLNRIRSLAIPPAWTAVWISPHEDSHLQATGRDARGRKQYRYHRQWRAVRDETKFGRMSAFAKALPRIRRRVAADLKRPGLPREKALATAVRLLETTFIRVGNEEYARKNETFGLTTLRQRQVRVRGSKLQFRFRGKSGVRHDVELSDAQVARVIRRMLDLPGYELFRYVDESGKTRTIESSDVNGYIKDAAQRDFTSKDFRTWAGTLLAAEALSRLPPCASQAEAKRNIVAAVEATAKRLGNTKAVCRKCYIHPAILESYSDGSLARATATGSLAAAVRGILTAHARRARLEQRRRSRPLATLLERSLAVSPRRGVPAVRPRSTARPPAHIVA